MRPGFASAHPTRLSFGGQGFHPLRRGTPAEAPVRESRRLRPGRGVRGTCPSAPAATQSSGGALGPERSLREAESDGRAEPSQERAAARRRRARSGAATVARLLLSFQGRLPWLRPPPPRWKTAWRPAAQALHVSAFPECLFGAPLGPAAGELFRGPPLRWSLDTSPSTQARNWRMSLPRRKRGRLGPSKANPPMSLEPFPRFIYTREGPPARRSTDLVFAIPRR